MFIFIVALVQGFEPIFNLSVTFKKSREHSHI